MTDLTASRRSDNNQNRPSLPDPLAGGVAQDEQPTPSRDSQTAGVLRGRASWLDRLYKLRDRTLARPAFQRWASVFPLTRPIARRQANALFDLCAGFVYSQILAACIRLRLFERLWDAPQTPEDLGRQCEMPEEAMRRLLSGAQALGLVTRRSGGRYGLGMLGAALHGNPGIGAMVEHHRMLYDDLRDPVALLRGERWNTELGRYWPYAANLSSGSLDRASTEGYTALMSASLGLIADDILSAYDFRRHKRLLDIGGGDGTFLIHAAAAAPDLRLTLFDLPAVAGRASERLAAADLEDRAQALGGDFLYDPLPESVDLVTLIRILLDHDDTVALKILKAARRAIAPGGVILIAETMSGVRGARNASDAYFGLYLFAMGRGRPRSVPEISALLEEAGFSDIRALPTRRPLLTNLVIARPRNASPGGNLY